MYLRIVKQIYKLKTLAKMKSKRIEIGDLVYCQDLNKSGVVIFESHQTIYVDVKFVDGSTKVINKKNLKVTN